MSEQFEWHDICRKGRFHSRKEAESKIEAYVGMMALSTKTALERKQAEGFSIVHGLQREYVIVLQDMDDDYFIETKHTAILVALAK